MVDLLQWRASIGTFYSHQRTKLEGATKWKELLTKAKPQPEPVSSNIPSTQTMKPESSTEPKKVIMANCTATPATRIEVGNTCCVTLLVGVHSNYILLFNFLLIIHFLNFTNIFISGTGCSITGCSITGRICRT